MTTQHRLIQALHRQPVDKTPIWVMRQAGRYLPEYRELRKKAGSFLNLCMNPELACQVTLQPLERFDLDAAIIFSDILTIPNAMGLGLYFTEGEGPAFEYPIQTAAQIEQLPIPDPETELRYVMDALRLTKRSLDNKVPLIGFSGSPWTISTYMVEGRASKNFSLIKKMCFANPNLAHQLLEKLSASIILYLKAQITAGADVLMIFDSWGGILTPKDYCEFSLNYMKKIIADIKKESDIPIILFSKQANHSIEKIADSGCNAMGLDWTINISEAKKRAAGRVALQGNLDPSVLYAPPEVIQTKATQILNDYGQDPGHIFNLGHGIYPDTPIESMQALIEAVHNHETIKNN